MFPLGFIENVCLYFVSRQKKETSANLRDLVRVCVFGVFSRTSGGGAIMACEHE